MGSSSVMTWALRELLIASITQASVVDLPHPAGPVTSTSPFCISARESTPSGMPRSCGLGSSKVMTRMTAASEPRCL